MPEKTATTEEPSKMPAPGSGHLGQTFLVGDEVYIRAVETADSKFGVSWTKTIFPKSTEWYETWVKEKMVKEKRRANYIVLRKADDVPVGGIQTWRHDPLTNVESWMDPLYGERGQHWLAEALCLAIPWLVDEQHRPLVRLRVAANQDIAIERLNALGARQVTRFREAIKTWGGREDALVFEYLNRQWVERLGDPIDLTFERSGSGKPRPVPAPIDLTSDPPPNAVRVGPRVYLRPFERKDAPLAALWSRQEPDARWDSGRYMNSAAGYEAWNEGLQKDQPQKWVRFAACLRESDELIGMVGIEDIDYVHRTAETESVMHRADHRGGGYGTEAKHLLFDYAFNTLNLHALQSVVIFPNTRSAAALRKQGYKEAGRLHWHFPANGYFENFICFDLLASDWRALPRASMNGVHTEKEGAR